MDTPPQIPPIQEADPPFFSVSLLKLGVMSVTTFGLYELYWMYENWKLIEKRTEQKMQPFWRAFFAFFFVYQLFKQIRETLETANQEEKKNELQAGPLAVAWIVITLLYKLPGAFFLLSWFSFIPLLVVQSRVNKLNALVAHGSPVNSRFTIANIVWLIFGGVLLVLAIIGSLLPDN